MSPISSTPKANNNTYGAGIFCSAALQSGEPCHAEPYPDDGSGFRETFDLLCVDGEWRCELHRLPKRKLAERIVGASPLAALGEFERLLEAASTRFEETIAEGSDDLVAAFRRYSSEVARGLAEVKKVFAAQKPTASPDDAPKNRPRKKIGKAERLGTVDWLAGDAQPAGEEVS
jgi:hypothetical protein